MKDLVCSQVVVNTYIPEQALWSAMILQAHTDIKLFRKIHRVYLIKKKRDKKLSRAFMNNYIHYRLYAKTAAAWLLSRNHDVCSFKWCLDVCKNLDDITSLEPELRESALGVEKCRMILEKN